MCYIWHRGTERDSKCDKSPSSYVYTCIYMRASRHYRYTFIIYVWKSYIYLLDFNSLPCESSFIPYPEIERSELPFPVHLSLFACSTGFTREPPDRKKRLTCFDRTRRFPIANINRRGLLSLFSLLGSSSDMGVTWLTSYCTPPVFFWQGYSSRANSHNALTRIGTRKQEESFALCPTNWEMRTTNRKMWGLRVLVRVRFELS